MRTSRMLTAVAVLSIPLPAAGDPRGEEIARDLAAKSAGYGDSTAAIEMVMRDAGGRETRRSMRLQVLERPGTDQGDLSLVVFDSPNDVRGTALLSHAGSGDEADTQWLYLPATRRARRVAGGSRAAAFLGSEFSYEDITGVELGKHSWTFRGEEACGKAACYRLETRPRYQGSGYQRREVWLEKGELRPVKIDFYDRKGTLAKTLTYGAYKKYDGKFWRAHTWSMVNRKTRRATELRFSGYRFKTGLGEGDFSKTALERAR
jgi:outer membrane lipoprotein-sorting protein